MLCFASASADAFLRNSSLLHSVSHWHGNMWAYVMISVMPHGHGENFKWKPNWRSTMSGINFYFIILFGVLWSLKGWGKCSAIFEDFQSLWIINNLISFTTPTPSPAPIAELHPFLPFRYLTTLQLFQYHSGIKHTDTLALHVTYESVYCT